VRWWFPVVVALVALVAFIGSAAWGPRDLSITCWWEQRAGWEVEYPVDSLSEAEFREDIEQQTRCVEITATYVNTGSVPDGHVVRPIGTRDWFAAGQALQVLIESEPSPGVVECGEPLEPPTNARATEVLTCGDATPPPVVGD
jgi:hypothetical protein